MSLTMFHIIFTLNYFLLMYNCDSTEDMKDLSLTQIIRLGEDVVGLEPPYDIRSSDVRFYLLKQGMTESVLINSNTRNMVDPIKPTKIIVHGWIENHRRSWYKNIGEQYLKDYDLNYIEVDYERPARMPYLSSAISTRFIGDQIAKFITNMKLSPKDVHLIGHSLGSHVVGFTGKAIFRRTGAKIRRISGLDPAGPYFRNVNADERLDDKDAEIVDIIHTDAGFYGYANPIGTLDIYVNGGQRIQPGCLDEFTTADSIGDAIGKYVEVPLNDLSKDCLCINKHWLIYSELYSVTIKNYRMVSGFSRNVNADERLDDKDAEIVDIIHTDAGFYGYANPIGTLDIYVNGGQRIQPGCLDEFTTADSIGDAIGKSFCSHTRSHVYFLEWIKGAKFRCEFCQPVTSPKFLFGSKCSFPYPEQPIGAEDVFLSNATGVCFATTNKEYPFLDF